jgi:signal transduction histidine kinase
MSNPQPCTPFDLPYALRKAAEACRGLAAERTQTLSVTVPSGALSALGDPSSFEQAVRQLLSAAMKCTPAGGTIALTAERDGDEAAVYVRDSGPGIDHRDLESIFEPFSKGEEGHLRQARGRGVGLALARRLLTLQGGALRAYSPQTGQGSEFVIRIPAARP